MYVLLSGICNGDWPILPKYFCCICSKLLSSPCEGFIIFCLNCFNNNALSSFDIDNVLILSRIVCILVGELVGELLGELVGELLVFVIISLSILKW